MTARAALLLATAALCAAASPAFAQDGDEGPPPPDGAGPEWRAGPAPQHAGPRVVRRIELRQQGDGDGAREWRGEDPGDDDLDASHDRGPDRGPHAGPHGGPGAMHMAPRGPGMMMPPPLPGGPGGFGGPGAGVSYAYPSPYPGWVYPPVAWVKVPIMHERDCGCGETVEEETIVTRSAPRWHHHRAVRHHPGKWVRAGY